MKDYARRRNRFDLADDNPSGDGSSVAIDGQVSAGLPGSVKLALVGLLIVVAMLILLFVDGIHEDSF